MADTALAKVEDAIKAALEAYAPLDGTKIITNQPSDVALEDDELPALLIVTVAYSQNQADELGQEIHTARIDVSSVYQAPTIIIGRANHEALAHVVFALAADRTLGGRLQSLEAVDVAPIEGNRADSGGVSVQFEVQWFTPRGDWFTILGHGGLTF